MKLGYSLRILQLNVEGQTKAKCEILAQLLKENDIDVALLQETHSGDTNPAVKKTIHG